MGRGGRRVGAGRKPGSVNARTAAIAQMAAQDGATPFEAMLAGMRYHYEKAQTASDEITLDAITGQVIAAPKAYHYAEMLEFARHAAPYIHPRLNTVEVSGPDGGAIPHEISHTEREQRVAEFLTRARRRMPTAPAQRRPVKF